MPNIPFTKERMKTLQKGLNLTREILDFNKETGQIVLYPNRQQRRDMRYRPFKGKPVKHIQIAPIIKYIHSKLTKKKGLELIEVTKKEANKLLKKGEVVDKKEVGTRRIYHY